MVVPLMAASLIGYAASRLVARQGTYHALAAGFLAQYREQEVSRNPISSEPKP
jgi:H+/Cl- antiporter ClcA